MLRALCTERQNDWDKELPFVLFAIRDSVQELLGYSPFELVYEYELRNPLKIAKEQWEDPETEPETVANYVGNLQKRLESARKTAENHMSKPQEKMQRNYDQRSKGRQFCQGEKVMTLLPTRKSPFDAKFKGPYMIAEKVDDLNYRINTPNRRRKTQLYHVNRIKKYLERTNESEMPVGQIDTVKTERIPDNDDVIVKDIPIKLENSKILENLEEKLNHLSDQERVGLSKLMRKFPGLFSDIPRKTNDIQHDVELTKDQPIKQHPYRVNPRKKEIIRKEIKYMLENGIIEPSQSPWALPCVLVNKPDGSVRFCTDYRKLNDITKADSYPIPRMEDCIDRIGKARFITKCDLLKEYWSVPLTDRTKLRSAFVVPDGTYQYKVMPFRMRNSQATFMRLMNKCRAGISNVDIYIDDIVIYNDT